MAKPVSVTWAFNTLSGNIPLAYLDTNFNNILTQLNDTLTYSNYVVDTGLANSYVVAFGGGLTTSYTAGLLLVFRAANNNTGASTLNVNALGARSIVNGNGAALSANQIVANSLVLVCYDGTVFRMLNDPSGGTVTAGNLAVTGNLTVGGTSLFTGLLTANGGISGALNGTVGATTPNTGAFTNFSYTGTLTGGTGIVNIGSGQVYKDASGNVGIGTASPLTKLNVVGGVSRFQGSGNAGRIEVYDSDNSNQTRILINPAFNTLEPAIQVSTNTPLLFATNNTERMRLDSSGNLGIGTASPSNRLDVFASTDWQGRVVGNAGFSGGFIVEGNATGTRAQINLKTNNGTAREYYLRNVSGTFSLLDNTAGTIPFTVEAATPSNTIYANASGNLGIGTASPGVKLDVVGAIRSSTTTSGSTVSATTDFRLNNATFSRIAIGDGGGGWVGGYSITYSGGVVHSDTGAISGVYYTNSGNIQFYAGPSASAGTAAPERMRITNAGNIVAGASVALATTATNGFLYVPTCAGTPTGTPTAITGMAPIVVNTTNNKLYFYSGGAWRDAGP